MKKLRLNQKIVALCVAASSTAAISQGGGNYEGTKLATQVAIGCNDVDLKNWSHPTRSVLIKAKAVIKKVQLCNDRKYPIFFTEVEYDPRGQTMDYFGKLTVDLLKANSGWPYSIVFVPDRQLINVAADSKGTITLDYEDF